VTHLFLIFQAKPVRAANPSQLSWINSNASIC